MIFRLIISVCSPTGGPTESSCSFQIHVISPIKEEKKNIYISMPFQISLTLGSKFLNHNPIYFEFLIRSRRQSIAFCPFSFYLFFFFAFILKIKFMPLPTFSANQARVNRQCGLHYQINQSQWLDHNFMVGLGPPTHHSISLSISTS